MILDIRNQRSVSRAKLRADFRARSTAPHSHTIFDQKRAPWLGSLLLRPVARGRTLDTLTERFTSRERARGRARDGRSLGDLGAEER